MRWSTAPPDFWQGTGRLDQQPGSFDRAALSEAAEEMLYDELLALAAELISRTTLSDAIHYGYSRSLPCGPKLGAPIDNKASRPQQSEEENNHETVIDPCSRSAAR
jgi:hypothetical protein